MNVDVHYQGLALAKGVPARDESGALFVELEMPMPVGTRLDVITPDGTRSGRVFSVVEGPGAGMIVAFGAWKPQVKAPEPNAPMAEMKSAPPLQVGPTAAAVAPPAAAPPAAAGTPPAAAAKEEGDDEPEPSGTDDGKKRRERRKTRKTVIGH